LDALETLDWLQVWKVGQLTSLDGMPSLEAVNGNVRIYLNSELRSVSGLAHLVQIDGIFKFVDNPEVEAQELYDWVEVMNDTPSGVTDEIEWLGQVYTTRQGVVANPLGSAVPDGMVLVSAGDFLYGDPTTSINLQDSFYIDKYEVTAGDYKSCVDAGVCAYNGGTGVSHTYDNDKDDHPINYVDWNEATAYCAWKGKHLPTEQEWEKAARGTDGRTYPWGEDAPDGTRSNYWNSGDVYDNGTTPVGYYNGVNILAGGTTSTVNSPGPYGAYDMAGNVFEWTNSWLSIDMNYRVLRGGSFSVNADSLRASVRSGGSPGYRGSYYGFRCAQ
jgi:formylglycine-generating enzyme required for sulfatase activity